MSGADDRQEIVLSVPEGSVPRVHRAFVLAFVFSATVLFFRLSFRSESTIQPSILAAVALLTVGPAVLLDLWQRRQVARYLALRADANLYVAHVRVASLGCLSQFLDKVPWWQASYPAGLLVVIGPEVSSIDLRRPFWFRRVSTLQIASGVGRVMFEADDDPKQLLMKVGSCSIGARVVFSRFPSAR